MSLRTDYKDYIPSTTNRKFNMIDNGDGTISLVDVTVYTEIGDKLGATDINTINQEVNSKPNVPSVLDLTLLAANWVNGVYSLAVTGVTFTTIQEFTPRKTITSAELEALQDANIVATDQWNGYVALTAFGDVPAVDIPITVLVRGF